MDYGKKSAHPHKAMVTDYDCWKENEEVNVENVIKQMKVLLNIKYKHLL